METKSNKTVSPVESAFLGYLAEEGKAWFSIEDAYGAFPDKSEGAVRFMLMRMLEKGLLIKVSKKAYWVVPFDQNAVVFHKAHFNKPPQKTEKHLTFMWKCL